MKISFLGDIMLGRFVCEKFTNKSYDIIASDLLNNIRKSDCIIANLESTITTSLEQTDEHLVFQGRPELLEKFKWIDCFSLSNNHINDCGVEGMNETVESLTSKQIGFNGLFNDKYTPYIFNKDNQKIAVITCCDMMNVEFTDDNPWKTIRIDDERLDQVIKEYKQEGYFIILYAHVGMLFTRFPNPQIRNFCHNKIDIGADLIVTVHPHVIGGHELYKEKNIFYSLGDFVMDGSSFRRRRSVALKIEIKNNQLTNWQLLPVEINDDLQTILSSKRTARNMLKSWEYVSNKLYEHKKDYVSFYKRQYKKEMIQHARSTVYFIIRKKGIRGLIRLISKRMGDFIGMFKRILEDRSNMRYDSDAVNPNRHLSNKDIK